MKEWMMNNKSTINSIGYSFQSKLVHLTPQDAGFRHLEYYPIINSRAHMIAGAATSPWIRNSDLKDTYEKFLNVMIEEKMVSDHQKLCFVYYLLL